MNANEYFRAILQLVQQSLIELDFLWRKVMTVRSHLHSRLGNLAQCPARQLVVLVDVGHNETKGGEDEFRMIIKVELITMSCMLHVSMRKHT